MVFLHNDVYIDGDVVSMLTNLKRIHVKDANPTHRRIDLKRIICDSQNLIRAVADSFSFYVSITILYI